MDFGVKPIATLWATKVMSKRILLQQQLVKRSMRLQLQTMIDGSSRRRLCACAAHAYKAGCSSNRDVTCCLTRLVTHLSLTENNHRLTSSDATSHQCPVSPSLGLHGPGRRHQSGHGRRRFHAGGDGERHLRAEAADATTASTAATNRMLGHIHSWSSL